MAKYSQLAGNNNVGSTSFLSLKSKYFENKSFLKTIQYYLDNSVKANEIMVAVPSYEDVREITFMLNSHKLSVSHCHPFDSAEVEVAFKYLRYFSDFLGIEEKKEAERKSSKALPKQKKQKDKPQGNNKKKNNDKLGGYSSYYTDKPAKENVLEGNSTPLLLDNASYNINNSLFQLLNEAYWTDRSSEKEEATSVFLHLMSVLYNKKVSFFEALEEILTMNELGPIQNIDISGNGIHKDYSKSFTFNFENTHDYVVVYNKAILVAMIHMVSSFQVGHALLKNENFPRPSSILTHFMRQYSAKKKLTLEQQKNIDKFISTVKKIEDDHFNKKGTQSSQTSEATPNKNHSKKDSKRNTERNTKKGDEKKALSGTQSIFSKQEDQNKTKTTLFRIVEKSLFDLREPYALNKTIPNGISILKTPLNWGHVIGQIRDNRNYVHPKIVIFKARDFCQTPVHLKHALNSLKTCFPRSNYIVTTIFLDNIDRELELKQDIQHLIWSPFIDSPPLSPQLTGPSDDSLLEMAPNYLEDAIAIKPVKNEIDEPVSSASSFYSMFLQKDSATKSSLFGHTSIIFSSQRIFSLRDPSLTPSINIGFSKINSYITCPLKYAFRYVLGLKNTTANLVNTSIGAILHQVANEVQEIENELEHLITTQAPIEKIVTKMTALKKSKKKVVTKIVEKITQEQVRIHKKKEKLEPVHLEKIKVTAQGLDNYLKHEPKSKKKKVDPSKRTSEPDTVFRDSVSEFLESEKDEKNINKENLEAFLNQINTAMAENESKGVHKTSILTEIAFVVKISKPGDRKFLFLRGAFDRIEKKEEGDIIIEMKKSFNPFYIRYDESKQLQLKIYALAYLKQHGRLPLEVQIRTFDRADKVFIYVPTMDEMKALEALIWDINTEIEKKVFHATPSAKNCRGCDFANFCPSSILKAELEKSSIAQKNRS